MVVSITIFSCPDCREGVIGIRRGLGVSNVGGWQVTSSVCSETRQDMVHVSNSVDVIYLVLIFVFVECL